MLKQQNLNNLTTISPIDGRYYSKTKELSKYFSEYALIKYRTKIEALYLIELSKARVIRSIKVSEKKLLNNLWQKFSLKDADLIKEIEKEINHDVKAVEYFITAKLKKTSLEDLISFIHFGLTSEDVNNLAYSLMIKDCLEKIYYPQLDGLIDEIGNLAKKYKTSAMISRTHGQPASPTTMGKELAVFVYRLKKQKASFPEKLSGKLAGAVGNYNAHQVTYPKINWIKFSNQFVKSLDLEPWLIVTQIEPHDRWAELFHSMIRTNNILLDFCKDIWFYIALDYLAQTPKKGEVGSSTMPHKVNPIDFENAEGNLGLSNAILNHFVEKLSISRMQRDLSDSTVMRNIGVSFAHILVALYSIEKGLGKLSLNKKQLDKDLSKNLELLSEAIQTILRRENYPHAYDELKKISRGRKLTKKRIDLFIDKITISVKVKKELKSLTVDKYIGLAEKLTQTATL